MADNKGEALRRYPRYLGQLERNRRRHMRTALFPGSFDPFHNGHLEIVETASRLFERIVIAPVRNPHKAPAIFSVEERRSMIVAAVAHLTNVEVSEHETPMLVVDVARAV